MKRTAFATYLSIRSVFLSCSVLAIATSHCFALAPLFHITDLGTLGGNFSVAHDINNSGQVVGFSYVSDNTSQRAFRTAPNSVINPSTDSLGTLGGIHSVANSINDLGQVVGDSYLADNSSLHVFKTSPNSAINPSIDDLGIGLYAQTSGINDSGQVTGGQGTGNGILHAYRTMPNTAINLSTDLLGSLGGGESVGYAINASGQVTGYSLTVPNNINSSRAIRVAAGDTINASSNLGTLGGHSSVGVSINDLGQVVGESWATGDLATHAFRTAPNAAVNPLTDDLGVLPGFVYSRANDINNHGWVVGASTTDLLSHAFLHDGTTTMLDLNLVLDSSGAGWTLIAAAAINDLNQIVGLGTHNGNSRAFRLDPVPEAAAVIQAMIVISVLGTFYRTRCIRAAFRAR